MAILISEVMTNYQDFKDIMSNLHSIKHTGFPSYNSKCAIFMQVLKITFIPVPKKIGTVLYKIMILFHINSPLLN